MDGASRAKLNDIQTRIPRAETESTREESGMSVA